ncbi:TlpA disulfide reductase family protein [Hymenobacter sp. BT559]|uniref:TlpA disulfide reductase family protein n=1 Tax=Hymenobacter sp. BT559 TaxID=2795729 RepID=UPI0018ECC7C9|nr:TlpA disulfide reductase family protein [Hymenobacter sp. BT559]MBJ6142452.1 AhpC/TSA family protein [Hymenobacter sp. BT559]
MRKLERNKLGVLASDKSGWLFLLWVVLLGGCQPKQQQQQPPREYSYSIAADIEGCDDCKAKLYIKEYTVSGKTDSTQSKDGHFSMRGKISQPGLYTFLYYSKIDKTMSGFVDVYLPTDSIHIKATKKQIRTKFYEKSDVGSHLKNTVVFSTSPLQKEWEQYLLTRDSVWNQFFLDQARARDKFLQAMGTGNKVLIEQTADSARELRYRFSSYLASATDMFVKQHPTSELSLSAMLDNREYQPAVERFRQYYNAMPAPLQASFYGQILDKALAKNETRNQNNQRFVGYRIRQLAGTTPAGKELNVEQLFKRNKLTLIEFWASWCGSCRLEMPKYYSLYKQYNSKGFGMLGISLDDNRNKWTQAIAEDSLRMPHLSELQGGYGDDIRRFAIKGIPANLLVDSTGSVVAVDVPYPKLYKQLQAL